MKILLDENIPRKSKQLLSEFSVFSMKDMNWLGKKNGELLGLMVLNDFDIFVTLDKNLKFQQNTSKFPISIFVLNAVNNRFETVKGYIIKLIETLKSQKLEFILKEINL